MPNAMPVVSIYLTTRNRGVLLRRALSSVFAQSLEDYELLIVDDCSSDDTADICSTICEADSRVRYLRTYQRSGAPYARNLAIRAARSDLVTGLDDDDEMLPDRLSILFQQFNQTNSLLSTAAIEQTETWHRIVNAGTKKVSLDDLLFDNVIGTQAITLKSRIEAIGGFDESLNSSQDYDLWVRLVQKYGPAMRLGKPTYIIHADNRPDRITVASTYSSSSFLKKHRQLMNQRQIASQEIYGIALRQERLPLSRWVDLTNRKTWRKTTRYFVTSRFPILRKIANAARSALSVLRSPR